MSEAARDSSVLLSRWVPLLRHEGPDWWERALGPPAADGPGAARDNRRHSSVRCSAPPRPLIYPTAPPHLTSGPAHTTTRQPQTLNARREASFLCRSLQQLRRARRPARRRRGRAGPCFHMRRRPRHPAAAFCGSAATAALAGPPRGAPHWAAPPSSYRRVPMTAWPERCSPSLHGAPRSVARQWSRSPLANVDEVPGGGVGAWEAASGP